LINHEHRHVFIHVPKTGGSSMSSCEFVGGNGHSAISKILSLTTIPESYFTWGFVRNPFDRLVSFHAAAKQHNPKQYPHIPEDFKELVLRLPEISEKDYHKIHLRMQSFWLCLTNKQGEASIGVDFVGRFENLQRDWRVVCEAIGISYCPLPYKNQSRHPSWQLMYTEEMRSIVARFFEEDFDRFRYPTSTSIEKNK